MREVPAYSQYLHIQDPEWKNRACGIASLAMLLGYFNKTAPPDEILNLAIGKNAYLPGIGWKHKELAELARGYGLQGNNYDWSKDDENSAFQNMKACVRKYPIMASVFADFQPEIGGHLIVVTNIKNEEVFYNDPNAKSEKSMRKKISAKNFNNGWKKRIIMIEPK